MAELGPYTAGEIPEPLVVTFTDASGTAINLTGYTARWVYEVAGTPTTQTAAVTDAAAGQVTYTWVAADLTTVGIYTAQMWVGNGTNRYASVEYHYRVDDGPGVAPSI